MILYILVSSLMMPAQAHPLMKAQTVAEFLRSERQLEQTSKWWVGCSYELQNHRFPVHCFFWLEKQAIEPPGQGPLKRVFQQANNLCVGHATELSDPAHVGQVLQLGGLNSQCRGALEIRLADLEYQNRVIGTAIE